MSAKFYIFSQNTFKDFESSGKEEVAAQLRSLIDDHGVSDNISRLNKSKDIFLALYEVIFAVVRGLIKKEQVEALLLELLTWHPDLGSILVEVISLVELETITVDKLNKNREQIIDLIKLLDLENLYKERLDIDTLGDAGLIKNKKNFLTKQIKVRTKMFYKQQKFNLLREESEGYAKLITELNQDIDKRITPASIIQVIRSLIGTFNLDPNRVLDLILEAFEKRPEESKFYSGLIRLFPHEPVTISEILGFKLNKYPDGAKEASGLFILIALLLQSNILSLGDIYDWLTPEDSSMLDEYQKNVDAANLLASKANVISTKDKDEKEKDKESKEKEEIEKEKLEQKLLEKYESNQKIQLAIALLEVGDWEHFMELRSRFADNYLVSCQPIAEALCRLILNVIKPLYSQVNVIPARIKKKTATKPSKTLISFPCVNSREDLVEHVFPMLTVLGPYICHNICLMYKLLRVARQLLNVVKKEAPSNSFYFSFLSILDECFLPAVSMFESNPCIAEEVWETLKIYPYHYRYKLYARWKDETYLQYPILVRKRTMLLKRAKYTMMRITKETVKPVSRSIGKQTHNFPGPVIEYILKQVQLYPNLIGPVVDGLKYLTSLSYDILGFSIVEILSQSKDRTQNDAMAISPWLQSLSGFTGSVCKKYSIDLGGILQFVANQLKSERSIDLLILRDIVQKMGGTDSMENLTPDQLDAMFGGDLLRREAGQYLQEKNTKRSSARLKEALLENNLGIPLLLLMAQQRSSIVYNQTESPHLKLVSKLYDQCQDTLIQFGSFLFQIITLDELTNRIPPIGSLLTDYHLSADVAFFFARPLFAHQLQNKFDELRKKDKAEKKLTADDKKKLFYDACDEVLAPMIKSILPHYSEKIWENVDPLCFLTFWLLTMSDLEVPTRIYEKEIKKLTEMPTAKLRKREIERIQALKDKLEEEQKKQVEHTDRVNSWLNEKCNSWFNVHNPRSQDSVTNFLQLCIFPRCTFSTLDAVYCARFVKMLHVMKTPNISTLMCYDKMFCDITYTVTSCTEDEIHHYSRFMLDSLESVMYWHEKEENFERECAKFPGFITRYRSSMQEGNDYVDYENFRHVVHKWHYKITKALVMCLESGDYIQIKNAILVLQGILPRFPTLLNLCSVIEKRIEKVKKTEKNQRNDLFVLANSYSGRLKAKKPSLIPEHKFHIVKKPENPPPPPSQATTASVKTENSKKAKESNGQVNGDVEMTEEPKSKLLKREDSQSVKEEMMKDERKRKEKDSKKKRGSKRATSESQNGDEDDSQDTDSKEATEVHSNSRSSSKKVPPPPPEISSTTRNSKRRKAEAESKSAFKNGKERSSLLREESALNASTKETRRDKRVKKRSSSPDIYKKKKSLKGY